MPEASSAMKRIENTQTNEAAIVVVGAGLVGAVQALLFATAGHQVTVIEQRNLRDTEDLDESVISSRTVALSNRSWQLLFDAGLWPDIDVCPIDSVNVTEQGSFGSVNLAAKKMNVEALGYVVSNALFEQHLHRQLRRHSGIDIIESGTVVAVSSSVNAASVSVDIAGVEKTVSADLVVAADGTHSPVRQLLNIGVQEHDYQQCAVLTNISVAKPHNNVAFERFTGEGPVALLPIAAAACPDQNRQNRDGQARQHHCSLILTAKNDQADHLAALKDVEFLRYVQKKFGGRLGRFESIGKRFITSLKLTVSDEQVKDKFVLLGNAARTLHPVAGQGLNLALRDAFELASCVTGMGDVDSALTEFTHRRSKDQSVTTKQTDLLARVFISRPWPLRAPISVLSTSSMLLLDFIDPVKNVFARTSMGQRVPLPRSADSQDTDQRYY